MASERPPTEYGEWTRGNAGQVGRIVVTYVEEILSPGDWLPVCDWEPHPDEPSHVATKPGILSMPLPGPKETVTADDIYAAAFAVMKRRPGPR